MPRNNHRHRGAGGSTLKASILGGTGSVLGGGKFANGAYTAAFQHLFNAEAPKTTEGAREAVLENAVVDESYSLEGKGPDGRWVSGQYKCNAYVFDVLEDAGFTPRLEPALNGRRVPDAGQWSNPDVKIAAYRGGKLIGYWKITANPKPGDVVAIKLNGEGNATRFSGHVGIVTARPTSQNPNLQSVIAAHATGGSYVSSLDRLNNVKNDLIYRNFIPK